MAFSDAWGYWRGTVRGDLEGRAEFRETPRNFERDDVEYYFETFLFETADGVLRGSRHGVYDLRTGEFWDHGIVEDASGRLSHLERYHVFERATTTTPGVFPMIGERTPLLLVPPVPAPGRVDGALVGRAGTALAGGRGSWHGSLRGDLVAKAEFWEPAKAHTIGVTDYFTEAFSLAARDGSLRGTAAGTRDRETGALWSCGRVSEAIGAWQRLLGAHVVRWGAASPEERPTSPSDPVWFILVPVRAA